MISVSLLAAIIAIAVVYYVFDYYRYVAKYPKGPKPIPFFGNTLQFDCRTIQDELPDLAKKYGNVFTLFVPIPLVFLTDYEGVKEAFIVKGEDFVGRPVQPMSELEFCVNSGVVNSNGQSWRENRRQAISILRDFGMGKGLMEEQVRLSVEEFLNHLKGIENKDSVNMRWPIQTMISNIINETLFGFRYKFDDCQPLVEYVETFNAMLGEDSNNSWIRFALYTKPWIMTLLTMIYPESLKHAIRVMKGYIINNVDRALKDYSVDSEPECFAQAYHQRIPSSKYLNKDQLMATCSDFFIAGQETTTTTLRWGVLYLTAHQRFQDKLREEILRVVGTDRLPSMADRKDMPYTTASVLEIQRMANVLQMNVLRVTTVDTEVLGHPIPMGTHVNGDIHTIMGYGAAFDNPKEFRPERYLEEDGITFRKDVVEQCIPFSIGKRQCAGEALARVELFLGLTAMVQHYQFLPCDGTTIDLEPRPSIVMIPKEQPIKLVPISH